MWYAVIERDTGRLHSISTVLAPNWPVQYKATELGEDFDPRGLEWDSQTQTFVVERFTQRLIDNILALPGIQKLAANERQGLQEALERLLKGEI